MASPSKISIELDTNSEKWTLMTNCTEISIKLDENTGRWTCVINSTHGAMPPFKGTKAETGSVGGPQSLVAPSTTSTTEEVPMEID